MKLFTDFEKDEIEFGLLERIIYLRALRKDYINEGVDTENVTKEIDTIESALHKIHNCL